MRDFRHALRALLHQPTLTAVAVATLALGIGGNTAMFTVVNAVLLRPLPFRDAARLVSLTEHQPDFPILSVSWQNYGDLRDQSRSFSDVAAYRNVNFTLTGGEEPERVPGKMITATMLPMLGVQPALGRAFTPQEDRAGGAPVAIISHALWQRRFGGARDVITRTLVVNNAAYSIVGVLPADFQLILPTDVFLPMGPWAATLPDDRNWHPGIFPLASLKPGVSPGQARAEVSTIASRLARQYPDTNHGVDFNVTGLHEQIVGHVRPALVLLAAAVGLVLLIACANIANLLLARTVERRREIAVRTALGASRLRLLRHLLAESVVLALAGGALGLLLARWGVVALVSLAGPSLPRADTVALDGAVLAFSTALSILTGVLFGLAPAAHASRVDLREALSEESRGTTASRGSRRLRRLLVVSEIAVATTLLVGAGLLLRSFTRLQRVPTGFNAERLLVADLPLSPIRYAHDEQRRVFVEQVIARVRALPGALAAGTTTTLPMAGTGSALHFNIQGRPPKSPAEFAIAGYRAVSPEYLQALAVPLVAGRGLTERDRTGSLPVVVINETMARRFFGTGNPLGSRLQIGATPTDELPWMEIVGVVGDVRQTFDADAAAEMFVPYYQGAPDPVLDGLYENLSIVVRTSGDAMPVAGGLRRALAEVDRGQPVVKLRTMEQAIGATVAAPRFRTLLVGIFAAVALLLAAIGVYGVMAYSVSQRTHEIGVRMALGATRRELLRLVMLEGLRLAGAGIAAGVLAALAMSRLMAGLLFHTSRADPATLVGAAVVLGLSALLASYLPARRALRVDPVVALR